MTQLSLVASATTGPTGAHDPLDRFYTPQALADAVVDRLSPAALSWVVEPSCGGGAFVRALQRRGCLVLGCDLDPEADGLRRSDLAWAGALESFPGSAGPLAWAIGNPPFGSDPDYLGLQHARICLKHAPSVALILPWSWLGLPPAMACLRDAPVPDEVWPIHPRPWGDHLRESAVWVWRERAGSTRIGEPLFWRRS